MVYALNMDVIQELTKHIGSQAEIARQLGLGSRATVGMWKGRIPPKHVLRLEELTSGEVTRYQMRPDIFGDPPEAA